MRKLKLILDRTLEVLLSIFVLAMVLVALWAIFTRHFMDAPASFTTEFLRFALLWTALLAAAYCFGKKAHLSITFVKNKFRGKGLLSIEVLTELIIIFFAVAVLIYGGIQGVSLGMAENSPTLGIPIGYIYLVLPISGVFTVIYSIINLVDHFRKDKINVTDDEPTTSTM